ncbi:hypothetical protein [Janibacter anophelis]|uniref:hypothetical protein n=1 Tax=Janibacter anophelis TaxID=319054 RepID=UPI000DEF4421|nr:hypothetical protein [Janibacter anophelis]
MPTEFAATHRASTLVASYCFPPYSDTAAVVAAKRVREQGQAVDVIYNAMDSVRTPDPSLLSLCGGLVRRFAAIPSPTHFSKWGPVTAFTRLGLDQALEWEEEQEPYERLYSRAHFSASHILGAAYALARPEVRWTAEFSDPLSHDVLGRVRRADVTDNALSAQLRRDVAARGFHLPGDNVFEWAEVLPFVLADELIFTNPNQRDIMLERCHDPQLAELAATKATVSPHPTLPREYYHGVDSGYELAEGRKHIGYFGNFYANRSMQTVVDALGAMPAQLRAKVTVHVFTNKVAQLQQDPEIVALGDSMVVRPYAQFLEFLNLCTKMDCLLVNDAVTPAEVGVNPFLPSKISDYKGSGTPVWGIVEPGSRLDLERLTYRSPVDHVSAALQVLAQVAHG